MSRAAAFAVACGLLLATRASGQAPAALPIRPLPASERFEPRPLDVTLRLSATRLPFGQAPAFTLVVRNPGSDPLLLHPDVGPNLRIFTSSGQLVPPFSGGIADYIFPRTRRGDLVTLRPGASHAFPVRAEFHPSPDYASVAMYTRQSGAGPVELPLPPGDYSIRFSYISFPDYAVSYDMSPVPPNIWYGRVETPPVRFTVLPPTDAEVRGWITRIDGDGPAADAIAAVRARRLAAAVDPLLRRFARTALDRQAIVEAMWDFDGGRPRLLESIASLPDRERHDVLASTAFMALARQAVNCDAAVPLILETIERSSGAVDGLIGTQAPVSRACASLSQRLRAIMRTPVPSDVPGFGSAYARAGVIQALGWVGNSGDVPLLGAVLDRSLPGLPVNNQGAMITLRQAAAQALGRIGGVAAGEILLTQLRDPAGNRGVLRTVVTEIARLRPDGAADALIPLLASPDQDVVTNTATALQQLGARGAVPALLPLLTHRVPVVRAYASRALLELGPANTRPATIAVPDDSDATTKYNVLAYLARHGQLSELPRFVEAVVTGASYVREGGVEGVAKFGTAATFVALRTALAGVSEENVGWVRMALQRLTFMPIWGPRELAEWDAWFARQASRTREDWAQDALDRSATGRAGANSYFTARALEYLAGAGLLSDRRIEQGLNVRDWLVRAAIADALAKSRPAQAAAVYLGELDSRSLAACYNAARKLAELAHEKVNVDCTTAADRQQAVARWSRLLRE
jgi:HEAT repeat protein